MTDLPKASGSRKDIDIAEMTRLYKNEGLTLRDVGKRLGVSHDTVAARLKDAGIDLRPRGPKPTSTRRQPRPCNRYKLDGSKCTNTSTRKNGWCGHCASYTSPPPWHEGSTLDGC